MLGKNNFKERLRKMEPRKERFSIRKFTIGAASVLIGFFFMNAMGGQQVQAADTEKATVTSTSTKSLEDNGTNDSKVAETAKVDKSADQTRDQGTPAVKDNKTEVKTSATSAAKDSANKGAEQLHDNTQVPATQTKQNGKDATAAVKANAEKQDQAAKGAVKSDQTAEAKEAAKQGQTEEAKSATTPVTAAKKDTEKGSDQLRTAAKPTDQVDSNIKLTQGLQNFKLYSDLEAKSSKMTEAEETASAKAIDEAYAKLTKLFGIALREERAVQSEDASDFQSLVNAMNDGNESVINITNDITITGKVNGTTTSGLGHDNTHYLYLDSEGSARNLTINGNGHTINFADYSLALQNKNYASGKAWNITIKNATIKADKYGWAPISFYNHIGHDNIEKSSLTFDGVTANLNNRPLVDKYASQLPVHFAGKNNINLTNMSRGINAVNASSVNVDSGNTSLNVDGDIAGSGNSLKGNNWMINASSKNDAVVINQGATLNLKSQSADIRGIWAGTLNAAGQSISGTVKINGNLNADMAAGHSTAIFTQNLLIGKNGNVTINTKQDNQKDGEENSTTNGNTNYNGTHYAPITLANGAPLSTLGTSDGLLEDLGSLTIIRNNTNKTLVPLISYGTAGANGANYTLTVGKGATLDLQDKADTYVQGTEPNSPYTGLITMWGTSSNDKFNITSPEYVNLQRSGNIRGSLIHLEGVDNNVIVNGVTPIAQWDQGNKTTTPNDVWYVEYLNTMNQWGTNAGQFMGKDQHPDHAVAHEGVDTLYNSNATVLMGKNQGADKYEHGTMPTKVEEALHLNSFLNNFNWWRPQRIAMGSKLNNNLDVQIDDSDKYQPEVQTINGKTNQTLNDLDAKKGIKDLIGPDEQTVSPEGIVQNVSWYNSKDDKAEWDKIMIQPTDSKDPSAKVAYPEPTNPIGNLKTTDRSAWAKVTYDDGSVDFVNIPLKITEPTDAEKYTPEGHDVKANKDEDLTNKAAEAISNKDTLPNNTTYTWVNKPDTSKVGVVPAIVNVTYPDHSVDQVPVNVIVGDTSKPADKNDTDADKNNPKGKAIDTTVGNVPNADQGVTWPNGQPTGGTPTYAWSQTPDVLKVGSNPGVVKVTYGDGSDDYVPTVVNVTDPNHPGTDDASKVNPVNGSATAVLGNLPDINDVNIDWGKTSDGQPATKPQGATVTWSAQTPNVNKPGESTGLAHIKYADGSEDYVPVNVKVNYTEPQTTGVTTQINKIPDATEGITNLIKDSKGEGIPSGAVWADPNKISNDIKNVTTNPIDETVTVQYKNGNGDIIYSENVKVPLTVTANDTRTDAEKYEPSYKQLTVAQGTAATDEVHYDKNGNINESQPSGESYKFGEGYTVPAGVTINAQTGTISFADNVAAGHYLIPVTVKYADTTSDNVKASVAVTGISHGDHETIVYGQNTTTSYTIAEYTAHKTTDGSETVSAPAVSEITFKNQDANWNTTSSVTYKLNDAGTEYVAQGAIVDAQGNPIQLMNGQAAVQSFSVNDVTTKWQDGFTPNTNTTNFSQTGTGTSTAQSQYGDPNSEQRTGEGENLPGNSKTRVTIALSGQAADLLANPTWSNAFGNIYGATTGDTETFKQGQDISGLSQDEFRKLINVTDLGSVTEGAAKPGWNGQNINPNAPQVLAYVEGTDNSRKFSMTWAPNGTPSTATIKDGVEGTVRIMFNDGTYLDVPAKINVVKDDNTGKPDDQKTSFNQKISYQYNGKEVASHMIADIAKGSSLSADQLKNAIDGNLPANYSIADGYTYPAAENNITKQPVELIVPLKQSQKQHDDSNYDATVTVKYVDSTNNNAPLKTKDNKDELTFEFNKKQGLSGAILKQNIDNNTPAGWKVASSFTYPGDQTDTKTITVPLVHATKDITPTTPGVDPTNPKYKDMFKTVTRDIFQTKPGETEKKIDTQSVEFGRNGIEDLVTGKVQGTGNWQVGTTQNNKFVLGGQAEFSSKQAPQISDYDSYVDGTKATEVGSASALKNGQPVNGKAVHITYLKSGNTTPVPYDPSDKHMNKDVTRTITIYKTDHTTDTKKQTVHFVRGGEGQNAGFKDKDGNIAYVPWTVAIKDGNSWRSTGDTEGTWSEYDVPQVDSYKSTVDGTEATEVDAKTVNANTPDVKVVVAYTKTTDPTDPSINPNKPDDKYKKMYAHEVRTINVVDPTTSSTDTTPQDVWFGRTMTTSTDPNVAPIYGDWQLGQVVNDKFEIKSSAPTSWEEKNVPTKDGYTTHIDVQGDTYANEISSDGTLILKKTFASNEVLLPAKSVTINITYTKSNNGNPGGNHGGGDVTPVPDVNPEPNPNPTPQGEVVIIYRDKNKNEIKRVVIPGTEGTHLDPSKTIEDNVPKGYHIKKDYTIPTDAVVSSTIDVPVVKDDADSTTPTDNNNQAADTGDTTSAKKGTAKNKKRAKKHISKKSKKAANKNNGTKSNSGIHGESTNNGNSNVAPTDVKGENSNVASTNVKGENANGTVQAATVNNDGKNAKTLPATGEKENQAGIFGLALASVAAMLGIAGDRKRKNR